MIQFSFNRFGKLARWSLTNDRSYYVRTFLQMLVVLTLVFLFFTMEGNGQRIYVKGELYTVDHYTPCFFISLFVFIITIVIGPSLMFYSMKGKHDRQTLLMLPASNLEKYLMRYSTWIILLPLYMLAFFAADLIQYVVNLVLGHDYATLVTSHFLCSREMVTWRANIWDEMSRDGAFSQYFSGLWLHSVYAVGATFFRSRKFNAIFTTITIIAGLMVWIWLFGGESKEVAASSSHTVDYVIWSALTVLNFWLSYKLFCRTQVIGKYINV